MCRNTFSIERAVLAQTAHASSTPLDLCFPSAPSCCDAPQVIDISDDSSCSPKPADSLQAPLQHTLERGSVKASPSGSRTRSEEQEDKYGRLSWTRRRQVAALEHSIAYIERLQAEAGGSVDGTRLPCLRRLKK
eukprot:764740-Hanusia_phi.AAC.1